MNAQTQTKPDGNALVVFQQPRLPYHDAINERFGVDRAGWKALTEAIFPNARTADSVIMALSYCRARKLDPFKRPVHIVPMWSSAQRAMVETVWPGIAELRTTAFRTGQYAGKEETEFGQMVTKTFKGTNNKGTTREVTVEFPEWGRTKMMRVLAGKERVFVSPKVVWLETYGKWGDTNVPNDMWAKRPSGQFEKCVEAAGLRCTFPEEIGNDLTAEEMEGQRIAEHDAAPAHSTEEPPPPGALGKIEHKPGAPMQPITPRADDLELVESGRDDGQQVEWSDHGETPAPSTVQAKADPEDTLKWIDSKLATALNGEALQSAWDDHIEPRLGDMFPPDREEARGLYRKHEKRLAP